jgi:hypothetical protein
MECTVPRCRATRLLPHVALCMVAAVFGSAPGHSQPLLANGDFESGTDQWGLSQQEGARADFSAPESDSPAGGKAARIEVLEQGLVQHLQLMHSFETGKLQVGEAYELRFWGRSEQPNTLLVRVLNRDRPWHSLGLAKSADLSGEWQEFRFPFRVRQTPQEFSKVDFFLGTCTGVVWLDGVRIEPFTREPIEGTITIESDDWSAQLTEAGALASLVHKPSGQRLVTGAAEDAVYEITLVGDDGTRTVTSHDADDVTSTGDGTERTFTHSHGPMRVTCTVGKTNDGFLAFTAEVTNPGQEAVTAIRYPILRTPIQLGEASEDDAILLPAFDGGIVENPKVAVPAGGGGYEGAYPGPLSCQVMAYYDETAGLYLGIHDPDGYPKRVRLATDVDFTFAFQHLSPILPGDDVKLTYPVVIGTFVGDWHDAAAIYRDWSRKQPWCAKPLSAPGKTPDWVARGALVTSFDPRRFRDLERLREHLGRFTHLYSAPLIPNNRGWERWDTWTGQEYLPPIPSEEDFARAAEVIREADGRGMIMLSGYRWTLEKKQPDGSVYSSQERFDREVRPYAVYDREGKEPAIGTSTQERDFRGQRWAKMCRATDFAMQTIVDISKYCVEHGYPVIHFDQEVSGAYEASVCGSRDHGHPPGDGRWVHLAMAELYRRIRAACEPLDEDFVLSMEEPNELYLPYLNLCQCRPFGLTTEWPGVRPMTRTVPLFSFLYHDYLIQWAAFYPWKSAGHPNESAAKGFAAGLMPGLQPYEHTLPAEGETTFSTFFANCMEGYLGFAREYLIFGKMLKPLHLSIPERTLGLGQQWGETTVPAVWHSLWELEDGRIGVVLINPEEEAHSLSLDLTPLVSAAGAEILVRRPSREAGEGSQEMTVEIGPLEMVLVEVRPR